MLKETKERLILIFVAIPIFLFIFYFNFCNYLFLKIVVLLINLLIFNELFNLNKDWFAIKFLGFFFIILYYLYFFFQDYSFSLNKILNFKFLEIIYESISKNSIFINFKNKYNLNLFSVYFLVILFVIYFLTISILNIFRYEIKKSLFSLIYNIFILIYSSFTPLLIYIFYKEVDKPFYLFLFFLIIVWSSNSFGYIVGMGVKNRHPLNIPVSPNKSSQGFIGAIILGTLVPFIIFKIFFYKTFSLLSFDILKNNFKIFLLIFLINILTILGDLFESMIKRYFQVKDSSNLFKGHGGILDIVDSILFAFPFYFFIIFLF